MTVYPLLVDEEFESWPEQFRDRQWCDVQTGFQTVASEDLGEIIGRFEPVDP